jgi:DNA-binding CsgD family transcriptional regulator
VGPRELYITGDLSGCLQQTEHVAGLPERILRVRALMRLHRYRDAIAAAGEARQKGANNDALLRALESECYSLEGSVAMARCSLMGVGPESQTPETQFEVAYARTLLAWVEGSPDAMQSALGEVDMTPHPHLYGQWLYAKSWIAALRGDYREQLRWLERAIAHIVETPVAYDVTLLANATRSLVHLVREIAAPGTFEYAVGVTESLPWTVDLEGERFLTFRGLAWGYALRGSHDKALQYAYFARDIAPSVRWVTACYADQAYLARMAGENASGDALLRHAVACAKETDWTSPGEERVAILNLVELAADRDFSSANRLMDIYDGIPVTLSPRLALARDNRMRAMEEYARGCLLAAAGKRHVAIEMLASAYSAFSAIGYAWRAAAAALRLHAVTEDITWLRIAGEAVAEFSESSVARDIRLRAAGAEDSRLASLTPAQRRVFGLICEGLSDKQIATNLGISPETVKNHAARVRAAFGVHSRSALVAAIRGKAV